MVLAILIEFGGGNVESESNVLAGLQAGLLDGLNDQVEGFLGGADGGSEAALVTQAGGQALGLHHGLQGVVHLGAQAKSLSEGFGTNRGDHEFLHIHAGVGVCATVDDVHHGHGQEVGIRATNVAIERQVGGLGGCLGHGHGHAQDGISAQLGLVFRAIELNQGLINNPLVVGFEADNFIGNFVVDVLHGL